MPVKLLSSCYEGQIDRNEINKTREERAALSRSYKDLLAEVSEILFRHDPTGINFEDNTDEYDSEAGTILPRLKVGMTVGEVQCLVYEEFVRWFDSQTAGPPAKYVSIASDILASYLRWPQSKARE